jgi:carbon monoxide dehydrogenase subunit G
MTSIAATIEIGRPPEDVFAYVTDPSHLPEWQGGVVRAERLDEGPVAVGTRAVVTRRIGRREQSMTVEIAELDPPRTFAVRSLEGPIRGENRGTIEPLDVGRRSRLSYELDLRGHGIGKLLVPLVVKRQAQRGTPRNMRKLKERLESGA